MTTSAKIEDEYEEMVKQIKNSYEPDVSIKWIVEQGIELLHERRVEP